MTDRDPLIPQTTDADDAFITAALSYLAGELDESEVAALEKQLAASPHHRRLFTALATQSRLFHELHRGSNTTHNPAPHADAEPTPGEASGTRPPISAAGAPIYRKGHEPKPARFRPHHYAITALAAALLAACGVAVYLLAFNTPSAPDPTPSQPSAPVATLIQNTGDLRTPHGYPAEGEDFSAGEYSLTSGAAEFMLTNAVNVKLRGETRMVMHNRMNVSLARGSARFVVPTDAKGFTVHLPDKSKIVDLGTAFRTFVDDAGRSMVHVTDGAVRLTPAEGSVREFTFGHGAVLSDGTLDTWGPDLIFSDSFDAPDDDTDTRLLRQRGALAPADWAARVHGSGTGTLNVTGGRLVLTAAPDRSNVESNAVLDRHWTAKGRRVVIVYELESESADFKHDFKIDPADASRNPASGVTIGARIYPSHVALFIGRQPVQNIQLAEPARRMRWVLDATDPPAGADGLLTLVVNGVTIASDVPYHSESDQRRVALAVTEAPKSETTTVAFDDFKISIEHQDKDDATE